VPEAEERIASLLFDESETDLTDLRGLKTSEVLGEP